MSRKNKIKNKLKLSKELNKRLKVRYFKENLFKSIGILAILLSLGMLALLFTSIVIKGYNAFIFHEVKIAVELPANFGPHQFESKRDYKFATKQLIDEAIDAKFGVKSDELHALLSKRSVRDLHHIISSKPRYLGQKVAIWVSTSGDLDLYLKGTSTKSYSSKTQDFIRELQDNDQLRKSFNWKFLTQNDSREAELAGIAGALAGSILTMIVAMLVAFPLSLLTGLYLEEFAPKNRITEIIEININNLSAIPSIVFGLLGLAIFLGFFAMPRSSTIVGGLTLALMILPVMIISTRQAIKAVPSSIKQGVLALGASPLQIAMHYTIPLSMPGIMTGFILAVSRAIGETAPLIMIGMVAFVIDLPKFVFDPATVMPVQIYLWADSPEPGFVEKTSGAIIILIFLLILINYLAIFIRRKYEKRQY